MDKPGLVSYQKQVNEGRKGDPESETSKQQQQQQERKKQQSYSTVNKQKCHRNALHIRRLHRDSDIELA